MFQAKHCVITGGSQGLGKALAIELAGLGANITIVARSPKDLESACKEAKDVRKSSNQVINWVAADVTDKEQVKGALSEAETKMSGSVPEFIFICAGMAKPGFFVEQPLEDFDAGIKLNYLGAVYTAKLATERMVQKGIRGRIIFVSSTVGLMGMVGYSQYSPTKFAIRGLAECLRQELLIHDISVHVYFVSTIETPGYERENRTKPAITAAIEGSDTSDKSPRTRALALIAGLKKGQFMITSDWATDMFRVAALGVCPANFWPKDLLLLIIGWIMIPVWRRYSDYLVRQVNIKKDQ